MSEVSGMGYCDAYGMEGAGSEEGILPTAMGNHGRKAEDGFCMMMAMMCIDIHMYITILDRR